MTYTYLHVYAVEGGGSFAVRERNAQAPSLHGLLIPNFTDNGLGASLSFFFFTPIHLLNAEREG